MTSLAEKVSEAYQSTTWKGDHVSGLAFAVYQSPALGDFEGPRWITFELSDGEQVPDYVWMSRTKRPIQVQGLSDARWEVLGSLQIGLKRIREEERGDIRQQAKNY